jgi:hypothetical protein
VTAAVVGLVILGVYITLILAENENSFVDVMPWTLLIATAVFGAFTSTLISDRRTAKTLVVGSAILFTALGLVSIFTIGLGLLLAASVAWVAAVRLSRQERT